MCRASDEYSLPAVAMRPMSQSPRPSDRTLWRASQSWPKKSARMFVCSLSILRTDCNMPFTVRHLTVYRYTEPVGLGEHRMMFRPRESHDLRLIRTNLAITPQPAHLRWLHDPFDNSVAVATFEGTTSELRFESTVTLEHFETSLPEYPLEEYARTYPFRYSDEDFPNLMRPLAHHYPNENVSKWVL